MFKLKDCLKKYTRDLDKAQPPSVTVERVKRIFSAHGGILAETRRIDTGRLDIPVFMSICGPRAKEIMPTRKQMGKGASPDQAEASALMELVERYSFFSFFSDDENFTRASWSEAQEKWPGQVMPVKDILKSVNQDLDEDTARLVLDLVRWRFCPALEIHEDAQVMTPLDWFKKLNEFNGSSAGNSVEESVLQGACELVERHVSAVVSRKRPVLPTIDPGSLNDEVLLELWTKFSACGIKVILKDFTLGLAAPTIAALAYDPKTFPEESEIVFTAGTATSPAKAAIRALTEVAQLAGDFETGSNYEASGLPKFDSLEEITWLAKGPVVPLDCLPGIENSNILEEIRALTKGLKEKDYPLYSVDLSHPELGLAANYNFVPGFEFRERTPNAGLGLFVGRILAEEEEPRRADKGLDVLEQVFPDSAYLPFFRGLLTLRAGDPDRAYELFGKAQNLQTNNEDKGMAAFYRAYSLTQAGHWRRALPHLNEAVELAPDVKEYYNLRGVVHFKEGEYEPAAADFKSALKLDSGSAMDLANLGLCHKFMGQKSRAALYLGQALELDPNIEFARVHLKELTFEE